MRIKTDLISPQRMLMLSQKNKEEIEKIDNKVWLAKN
jgi:hypothetical protein